MKKDSAFKLKSGNKPSIAKFFGKFAKGKKVTATSGNTVTRGISKPDAKKRPKPMQNLNKAISDALPKGKSKTSKTSKTSSTRARFNKAFAAARKAGKKVFEFEGKSFTTKLKEE